MEYSLRLLSLSIMGILLLMTGCDPPPTSTQANETEPLLTSADYGPLPLPGLTASPSKQKAGKSEDKKYNPSTIALLKRYITNHNNVSYAAAAGQWRARKQQYKHTVLPLYFPDRIVQAAQGQVIYYSYYLANATHTFRNLQAVIPASEEAAGLMDQWLKKKRRRSGPELEGLKDKCENDDPVEGTCVTRNSDGEVIYTTCGTATVCGSSGGGGGSSDDSGGSGNDSGGSGGSTDDNWPPAGDGPPSDDSGGNPCPTCGGAGGGSNSGGDDGDDSGQDLCDKPHPPPEAVCEEAPLLPDPEPCETGGKYPALEQNEADLKELWNAQQDSNKEQVGFFAPLGDSYTFQSLDNFVTHRSATRVKFKINPSTIPDGAIYVHTHPTRETAKRNGFSVGNYHHASYPDKDALQTLGIDKGFILDEGKILVYDENGVTDDVDRCGY
ncbi:MAG TPA: hypothetical protein VK112_11175 [Fodinibius sp.]|nr:hypothetical protein [Fodinibius sp.]